MPNVFFTPQVEAQAFYLRPPALLPNPQGAPQPALYTEDDAVRLRAEAFARGQESIRGAHEILADELKAEARETAGSCVITARALQQAREALLHEAAEAAVDLAYRIAEKVLRASVEASPEAVIPVVRELLQRTAGSATVVVRLSPRDHGYLLNNLGSFPEASGHEGLRVCADATVSPGGCVVETEAGALDARLETQLERIAAAVLGNSNSAAAESPGELEEAA